MIPPSSPSEDRVDYHAKVEAYTDNLPALKEEVHHICRENYPERLEIMCQTLSRIGVPLDSTAMEGGLTESPLHVALVFNHNDVAKILIQHGGAQLVMKQYRHRDYEGVTTLHLAIGKNNKEIILEMLSKLDEDQKKRLLGHHPCGKHCKTWGLPLSMSALSGNRKIFSTLLRAGADLLATDVKGNTVFHSLAILAQHKPAEACRMYQTIMPTKSKARPDLIHLLIIKEVLVWWSKRQGLSTANDVDFKLMKDHLLRVRNNDRHTALTLATSVGAIDYVEVLLDTADVYVFPQWQCGPHVHNFYDMSEIDTAVGEKGQPRVLEQLAYSSDDRNLRVADIPALKAIIHHKWKMFRFRFYLWAIFHLLVMTTFTICTRFRLAPPLPRNFTELNLTDPDNDWVEDIVFDRKIHQLIIIGELIVLSSAIAYLCSEIYDVVMSVAEMRSTSNPFELRYDAFRGILLCFSSSSILLALAKMTGCAWTDLLYAVVSISGWGFMLFFSRAFQEIGIFTVMLQRILVSNVFHFTCVFLVFLLGFGTAILCLFQDQRHEAPEEVATMAMISISLFRFLVGMEELDIGDEAHMPWVYYAIIVAFIIFGNVLLFNMLIAAMSATYDAVADQKENLWLKIRTRSILMLERRLLPWLQPRHELSCREMKNASGSRQRLWLLAHTDLMREHPLAMSESDSFSL